MPLKQVIMILEKPVRKEYIKYGLRLPVCLRFR